MLKKSNVLHGPLTSEELSEAERFWIQFEQEKFFSEEFKSLKDSKIENESPLYNYIPYLDENRLIRLGGRLEFCNLSINEKHPLILPKNSWLTTLIVRREHNKVMHGGTASTLAQVRSNYWIPKGRQLVKKVIRNCFICRKYLAEPIDQLTSPLPSDRINQTPAFSVCGLDFALDLSTSITSESCKYPILFYLLAELPEHIHLELVSDMTTNSFLLAFRRFLARRVKNPETHPELKVGDVLIEENTKNKLLWKLGKIERTLPERDNKTRCYELKTSGRLLKRTVQHLYPLEL
ncbi:uncharacterized protein TNIN_358371 [Trichonephila inaurata madagascariensis]|uniref:Integrase zinc-binding domain-containing protein n=1 Tax=Trichonephila inaurata madagascariensis TaxID=2747483 RepID=A0A8X6XMI4_9ARAC|nr:uncharacterized protein TNIN_358371 [Trichonephila inaurata madagascariensis]